MLLPIVVFLAVGSGCIGLVMWLAPDRTEQRLNALAKDEARPQVWGTRIIDVVTPFARLSTPSGDWETSPLRVRFMNAGIRHAKAPHVFFGLKTLLPVLAGVPTFLALRATQGAAGMTLVFWVLGAATLGCYLPNVALSLAGRARQRDIFDSFPDAADLLLVCVEAGLGLDAALTRVAEELADKSPALAEELQLTNLEMRAGGTREKSLHNLALRTGVEELTSFATLLTQADRFGVSIGDSLRVFSEDLRHKRQARAEEKAAKIPTKMLFPLVLFIFPSIIMVVLGPAVIQIVRELGPMLSSK
ncbi:type II secretion system F family protein [Telluria mixta]|uniref:Type II secretion system F family protein n=1 Tax=Telluria mixta TaxID=34071 RepID=A0ABT2BSC0_9BURK|nr:type II secretion system F family protein [Telluria mixta]MCS0628023.1 type II secretion system F family protein [Telluria mixta]WEM93860.1 type II secretion system F family protein [Telluria mixta]